MAEHPGVDVYCYFNGAANYIYVVETIPQLAFQALAVHGIEGQRTPDYKGELEQTCAAFG